MPLTFLKEVWLFVWAADLLTKNTKKPKIWLERIKQDYGLTT